MEGIFILGFFAIVMSVPLTAILTAHHRKMAELNGPRGNRGDDQAVAKLAQELAELRQIVAEQAIIVDDLNSMHRRLLDKADQDAAVRQRLGA